MSSSIRTFAGLVVLLLVSCSGPAAEPQAINVVVSGMLYQPASLKVKVGQPVRLTLTNKDALEHDFSITEFSVEGVVETDGHAGHDMGEGAEQQDVHVGAATNGSGTI